jgi:uncharacterized membrane protein
MAEQTHTFGSDFRKFFLRGLGILLPSIITIALVFWAYNFLQNNVAAPINASVRGTVRWAAPQLVGVDHLREHAEWYVVTEDELEAARADLRRPNATREQLTPFVRSRSLARVWADRWYLHAIGFVVAVVLVYLAGVFVGNFVGRRIYQRVEGWLVRLPVIKQVYPNVKQVTDFLFGGDDLEKKFPSSRVVLVEYPRKGIWTVGLMTGETLIAIERVAGVPCVTVFIPSSPTPFTGYTITVPKDEVFDLPISFDEAIRFVVSGGVLVPARQSAGRGEIELADAGSRETTERPSEETTEQ